MPDSTSTNETIIELQVQDFVTLSDKPIIIKGAPCFTRQLLYYVDRGYHWKRTSSYGYLCGLFALEISLRPIYLQHNLTPPTFENLEHLYKSDLYREHALQVLSDRYENLPEPQLTKLEEIRQEDWVALTNPDRLHYEALSLILKILSAYHNLRIALGIIQCRRKSAMKASSELPPNPPDLYSCRIEDGGMPHYTDVAWVINDNVEDLISPAHINHWSGMAPTHDRVINFTNLDTSRAQSPSSSSASGESSGSNPRKHPWCDDEGDEPGSDRKKAMFTFGIPRSRSMVSILQQRMKLLQLTRGQPTPEERQKLLTMLPMAAHIDAIDRTANIAYISVNLQNFHISNPVKPLYEDVKGIVPAGHSLLEDENMCDRFLPPDVHEHETRRAYQLSKKPIASAPPYGTEPPWEEMDDITIEELIIYFPNHVLRWPALALILRLYNWDHLFHRTARFINIARGSGYCEKGQKHAEVLPCMMKVERAIQEIEPRYQLADHEKWVPEIDQAWLKQSLKLVPKTLQGKQLRKLSLEEVASYVEQHEFADRSFSRRVRHALDPYIPCTSSPKYPQSLPHPLVGTLFGVSYPFTGLLRAQHFAPAPTGVVKGEVDVDMDTWSNSSYDAETEDNTQTEVGGLAGHQDSKYSSKVYRLLAPQQVNERAQRDCKFGSKCNRANCKFRHPQGHQPNAQMQQRQQSNPEDSQVRQNHLQLPRQQGRQANTRDRPNHSQGEKRFEFEQSKSRARPKQTCKFNLKCKTSAVDSLTSLLPHRRILRSKATANANGG